MEMEGRVRLPFPKGITSWPWASSEEGEQDETGKFWGRETTTQHFSQLYVIPVDLNGSVPPPLFLNDHYYIIIVFFLPVEFHGVL